MKSILNELGVVPYINAHDTITLYGASRMEESTIEAMNQMAECFTDIPALQANLGDRIAKMTHNEAAYIANCAAGALQLCAAVCLARGSDYIYRYLPDTKGNPNEIIVLHSQHNCYDKALEAAGISARVINMATIKPLDEALVLQAAKECGKIVTAEEHNIIGGLGEAVCACVAEHCPVPVKRIGVQDTFGHSGPAVDLLKQFGLCADNIASVTRTFVGK